MGDDSSERQGRGRAARARTGTGRGSYGGFRRGAQESWRRLGFVGDRGPSFLHQTCRTGSERHYFPVASGATCLGPVYATTDSGSEYPGQGHGLTPARLSSFGRRAWMLDRQRIMWAWVSRIGKRGCCLAAGRGTSDCTRAAAGPARVTRRCSRGSSMRRGLGSTRTWFLVGSREGRSAAGSRRRGLSGTRSRTRSCPRTCGGGFSRLTGACGGLGDD